MQALIELIAGVIAMLAAAALSQFGVDLNAPQKPEREIHRVRDCTENASTLISAQRDHKREC